MKKKKKGLATLPKERRIEIARMGGLTAFYSMKGHRWNRKEAREAAYLSALSRQKKVRENGEK